MTHRGLAASIIVMMMTLLVTLSSSSSSSGVVAWSLGRVSRDVIHEQVHAHYKQYLTDNPQYHGGGRDALLMKDTMGDMLACPNITGPINWIAPQDLGAHEHVAEYWFYLGLMTDSKTNTSYGIDFTVWRFALSCPDPTAVVWYFSLGIADERANTYYSGLQTMWGPFVSTNNGNTPMNLAGPDGQFSVKQDPSNMAMFSLNGWVPQYPSTTQRMNISIKVNSINGDQAMADRGFSCAQPSGRLGAAQYEATRMQVLGGQLTIDDTTHQFDRGDVYLQHMWESTTDYLPADPNLGWDWAWVILDNGWSYSLTHWRSSLGVYTNYSYCNVIRPGADGKLENIYLLASQWTRIEFGPVWTSPHTNVTYSLGHRLTIPSLGLVLDSVPLIHDNEVNWHHNKFRCYEGIGRVNGTVNGIPFSGSGGTEFVGIGGMT